MEYWTAVVRFSGGGVMSFGLSAPDIDQARIAAGERLPASLVADEIEVVRIPSAGER